MSRFICFYAKCHYAECHYAECRYAECRYAECRYAECRGATSAYLSGASVTKKNVIYNIDTWAQYYKTIFVHNL